MKDPHEYVKQFLQNTTPAEMRRIAKEWVKDLEELKAERCGEEYTTGCLAEIVELQGKRWRVFATGVNREVGLALIDPDMFRDSAMDVLLAMVIESIVFDRLPQKASARAVMLSRPLSRN